jgi:hypothetical protein
MSYTFLQEQGAESSVESFSDIPAYVLSRLNLTAGKSCYNGNGTESCRSSRSGTMLEPSTDDRGEEQLMLFAEDSHARTSVYRERDKDSTENGQDSGQKWQEWFAKLDPGMSWWKIRQLYLFEGWEQSLEIWPKWGWMHDGECFPLGTLAPLILENVSGFWPTPVKTNGLVGFSPLTMERKEQGQTRPSGAHIGTDLKWDRRSIPFLCKGVINPILSEWLMGWPIGATDLLPLETAKFQQWFNSHGRH